MKTDNLKHLKILMSAPKVDWKATDSSLLVKKENYRTPKAYKSYKTIHQTYVFAFKYSEIDSKTNVIENKFGKFTIGVDSKNLLEIQFYTKLSVSKWVETHKHSSKYSNISAIINHELNNL